MHFLLNQTTLIQDQSQRQPADIPVYLLERWGERVLVMEQDLDEHTRETRRPTLYGVGYFAVDDRFCVIPNVWSEHDADLAYMALRD